MSDLKLVQGIDDRWDLDFDAVVQDLVLTDDIETSVTISVETIARAKTGDDIPDGTDRKRGFWGDDFLEEPEDTIGSRLWLLTRSKMTSDILSKVRTLFDECLSWMVLDGVATSARTQAALYSDEVIAIRTEIVKPDGTTETFPFFFNWQAQELRRATEEDL